MYDKLPVGAVVRLRCGDIVTISEIVIGDDLPVRGMHEGLLETWSKQGGYFGGEPNGADMDIVEVVHYGTPAHVVSPVVAAVGEALRRRAEPINRIERKDVDDFRNGNYCERNALDQYQTIATKSAIYPGQGTPFGVMYAALGLAEAGEIQNKVKKMFRDDGVIDFVDVRERETVVRFNPITPERRAVIVKEMGGNLWYLAALAREIGTTLSEVAGNNLDELCGRTDRDTLNGDGDNR
nr:MAG TPA: hypothetical protein [Caudoviricetes sp.]